MVTVFYSTTLVATSCGNCGIPFGLPTNLYNARREDGEWFYCPNGHKIAWGDNENSRLTRQLDMAKARLTHEKAMLDQARADAEHQRHRANGMKGALVQTKKRQAKGVCPVQGCKRHFVNVERHIANQHPDYAEDHA